MKQVCEKRSEESSLCISLTICGFITVMDECGTETHFGHPEELRDEKHLSFCLCTSFLLFICSYLYLQFMKQYCHLFLFILFVYLLFLIFFMFNVYFKLLYLLALIKSIHYFILCTFHPVFYIYIK